ncbi:MAG: transposase [Thermodesulfobacteriota bacterium]|nr:transposase [Thermodesulfobacteriota bacterium]
MSEERIRYILLNVNFEMPVDGSIEKVPVLVAIGFTETGQKLDLGFQAGDKESASPWRESFKDLREEFPKAKVQRCQIHVARNVLAKVPKNLKKLRLMI